MESISHENINFKKMLFEEAKKNSITLDNDQINKFIKYKELLKEWNNKINLTAITEDRQILMKHFIDSLEVVKYINKNSTVIDVGTGAGFPGIVIAIYFKGNIKITLMDALNKRIDFLEEVIKELNLLNIEIVHARAEEFGQKEQYRERYDYAVSRAVAPLNILLEFDIPFIKVGGKCLLLKGTKLNEEIQESNKALENLNSKITNIYKYNYILDDEEYNRNIVEIIKEKETPNKYPRIYGKIKKSPL